MALASQHPVEQAGKPRTAMERKQKENKVQKKKGACTEMLPNAIVDLRSPWDAVVEYLTQASLCILAQQCFCPSALPQLTGTLAPFSVPGLPGLNLHLW